MSYNKKALRVDLGKYYKPNPYKKDIITDPAGQWKYPGQPTRIPGNKITMQGVPYPVYGQDDQGNGQMMYPGQEYVFPGNYVDEYPQMKVGGIPELPLNAGRRAYHAWGYTNNDFIANRQDGGPTYMSDTDLPLGYNPIDDTINYDPNDSWQNINNPAWKNHEDYHHKQNMEGRMSLSGKVAQRPNPYVASDDAIASYYNRRETDLQNELDNMQDENPMLQFIPREKLRYGQFDENGQPIFLGAEERMYSNPNTEEGEARLQEEEYQKGGSSDRFKKRLMNKYPGMQGVYGPEGENLNIIKDPNYAAADHGFGNIEFIFPGSGLVTYSDDYQYQSPTPDKYTAVYNPRGANKHDVYLDMMHGMRNDPDYMKLIDNFATETKKARGRDMDYWYEQDLKNHPDAAGDGRDAWDNNFIDGVLRSHLAQKGMGRHSSGAKGYKLEREGSSPEMRKAVNDIHKYLKGKDTSKDYIEADLTPDEIEQYRQGGYVVEDISIPSLNSFAPGGINTPTDLSPENLNYYLTKLRFLENSVKKGFKDGKWYPHKSTEGGNDTVAYGHKILPGESFDKGITEAQARRLQKKDALEKQRLAEYYVDKKYGKGTFDSLPQNHQMLLLDYQYNVKGGINEFPNFTKALVESDKAKALSEHERVNLDERNKWTKDVLKKTYFPKQVDDSKPTLAKGGYIEAELTPEEIQAYKEDGYDIEYLD